MPRYSGNKKLRMTNHGLDIRVRHSVKLVELEFVIRTDVDVGALVFGAVTVLWGREDCRFISCVENRKCSLLAYL